MAGCNRIVPLQRTHLAVRRLRKLTPSVLMGVNLRKVLIMWCVHCGGEEGEVCQKRVLACSVDARSKIRPGCSFRVNQSGHFRQIVAAKGT